MSANKLFVMKEPVFLKHHTSRQRELDLVKANPKDYHVYTDIKFFRVPKSPPLKQSDQQKKDSKYKDALWAMKTSRIKGKLKSIQDKLSIKMTDGKMTEGKSPARRNSNTVWKKIVAKSLSRSNSPYWNNSQVPQKTTRSIANTLGGIGNMGSRYQSIVSDEVQNMDTTQSG
jgi:hypothetical protein